MSSKRWLLVFFLPAFSRGSLPVLTEHPVSLTVPRGEPATLNCGATGDPEPIISWYKDGSLLDLEGGGDHIVLLPGGSLFFLRTLESNRNKDSGSYHCRAENRDGAVQSRPARLIVTYLKNKFGSVPRSLEVSEGEELRLKCLAPEGNPTPSIYWERDGLTLLKDDFFRIDPSGDLVIPSAGVEDAGGYVCLASSADTTRRDAVIRVKVARKAAVVIDRVVVPETPVISEAVMVDTTTGLVHWGVLDDVTGYTLMLTADGDRDVTNISVEHDVNQIKLHSLDPSRVYSVQVAGVYGHSAIGPYSAARLLTFKTHEVVLVNNEEIPLKVWAIAMAIVIIVTLTIVMAAALLCYKTKKLRSRSSHTCSEYGVGTAGRNVTWDRRWDEHSPTTSFRSENRLLQGGYEYAIPTHQVQYSGSNHYASNTILKPSYYEPLNLKMVDTSNSSFESEYKTPLDMSRR